MIKDIYLAGGCFWGAEHFFRQIDGVVSTEVGFANGHTANPSYKEVYTDTTGYAETVHVRYDRERVGLRFLLKMFFKAIDPRASITATRPTWRPSGPFLRRNRQNTTSPSSSKSKRSAISTRPRNTIRITSKRIPTATATCRSNCSASPARPGPRPTDPRPAKPAPGRRYAGRKPRRPRSGIRCRGNAPSARASLPSLLSAAGFRDSSRRGASGHGPS